MSPVLLLEQTERDWPVPTWCPATESQHTSSPHPGLIPQDLVPEMSCHASGSTQEALQFWDKGQAAAEPLAHCCQCRAGSRSF